MAQNLGSGSGSRLKAQEWFKKRNTPKRDIPIERLRNGIFVKSNTKRFTEFMYQSIPRLTIPPGDLRGFSHSSCPWGRVFAPLSCPRVCPGGGVLNQSKSSIILKKSAIFALSLKQMGNSSSCVYICQKRAV